MRDSEPLIFCQTFSFNLASDLSFCGIVFITWNTITMIFIQRSVEFGVFPVLPRLRHGQCIGKRNLQWGQHILLPFLRGYLSIGGVYVPDWRRVVVVSGHRCQGGVSSVCDNGEVGGSCQKLHPHECHNTRLCCRTLHYNKAWWSSTFIFILFNFHDHGVSRS